MGESERGVLRYVMFAVVLAKSRMGKEGADIPLPPQPPSSSNLPILPPCPQMRLHLFGRVHKSE